MQSRTIEPTYAAISVAHRILAEAMPPGVETPSRAFIRRAAQRGYVRVMVLGGTKWLYNVDDVKALVTAGGYR